MFDRTVDLFDPDDSLAGLYSCILTGVIGYLVTYILYAFESFYLKRKGYIDEKKKPHLSIELIFYLLAFLAMNAVWRTWWAVSFFLLLLFFGQNNFLNNFKLIIGL
jgi:hypothetical protein